MDVLNVSSLMKVTTQIKVITEENICSVNQLRNYECFLTKFPTYVWLISMKY